MRFCNTCGKEVHDNAIICPHCGCGIAGVTQTNVQDAPSAGFAILSFFFPIIGLILYLVWKNESPLKAKSCGKGALIGVIVNVAGSLVYSAVIGTLLGSIANAMI